MLDLCATRLAQRFTTFLANNSDTNLIFLAGDIFSRYFTQNLKSIQTMYPQILVEWSIEVATDWHEMKMATKQFYVAPDTIFRFLSTISMKSHCGCLCKLVQKFHWTMLDACRKPSKVDRIQAWRHFAKHWQFGTSIIFQGHYLTNPKNALFTITTHLHGSIPKNGGNFMTPVLQTTWFGFNHLMLHQLRLQPSLWVTSLRIRTARNFRNSSAKKPSPCEKQH